MNWALLRVISLGISIKSCGVGDRVAGEGKVVGDKVGIER